MERDAEGARLERLFGHRRDRLLDLSGRNPLVSYKHRPASKRQLRFIDTALDAVFGQLTDEGAALAIQPLPEPDEVPIDERTGNFVAHLEHAKSADATYLEQIRELESAGTDGGFAAVRAERELRDRVRAQLGLPPRPALRAIDPSEHARTLGIDPTFDLSEQAPEHRDRDRALQTLKWPDALDALLDKIADDARLAEQEMGLSTLFLVFGFVEWFEAETSEKPHTAPLLLLPARLEKRKAAGRKTVFNLVATSEMPETNLSLRKRLDGDFNLLLPDFTLEDEDRQTVSEYLTAVHTAIQGQKRWRVRRQLTLGHFAFGRLAVYADLEPEKWRQHPVRQELVRSVLSGTDAGGDVGAHLLGPAEDYVIDDPEVEAIAPHLIHDADASQHSALIDVMKGKSLVIQGPPGTGKSQTITNVIANLIGNGKSVLFLAEKQAALEVVKRRMDKAGLGEFCLELHSDRGSARRVIESLKARHAIGYGGGRQANGLDPGGRAGGREIGEYLSALHRPLDGGVTPFAAIWRSLRAAGRPELHLSCFHDAQLPEDLLSNAGMQGRVRSELALYSDMLSRYEQRFGRLHLSPWSKIGLGETLGPGESSGLLQETMRLRDLCQTLVARIDACTQWGIATSGEMVRCASALAVLPAAIPEQPMLDALREVDRPALHGLLDALEELRALEQERSSLPRLDEADAALLEAIEKSAALSEGDGEAASTPAERRRKVESTAHAFRSVGERLTAAAPVMQAAGIGGTAPGSAVVALGLIAELLSRIPRQFQAWALSLDASRLARFEELYGEWEHLAQAEARWRGRFPGLEHNMPWPSPAELAHVAGLLRKGWLARQLGSLAGDRQTVERLACRLRLPAIALPGTDELQAMAQHVGEVGTFLANRAHRQLLGVLWGGLDSPFESLHGVCRETAGVLARVEAIAGGAEVLRGLRACHDGVPDKIVAGREALRQLAELPTDLGGILSAHAIDEIFNRSRTAEDRLARLAAADPGALLLGLPHSLEVLDRARRLELRRRHLTARIQACGLSFLVPLLAASAGTETARAALDWLDATARAALPQALREALDRSAEEAGQAGSEAAACAALNERIHAQSEQLQERFGLTGLPVEDAHQLLSQLTSLLGTGAHLKDIVELRDQKRRLEAAGIGSVLQQADDLGVPPGDWCALLDALVASRQARRARVTDPALRRVSGLRLDAQRRAFIEQDRRKVVHDREALRTRLCAVKPPLGSNDGSKKHWTEMRLLHNEFNKERKLVPVRQLAARAGRAMLAMKPCFMMSPLSLAKFLPPGSIEFDVLVIDEASQMKPEDALGGLLRARQVVVVGDQKQLPPTDFFARSGEDDAAASAEDEDFEDSDDESILEACQKAFSNTRMLRWHYRSRCESLIAFSNANFYRNELITFPVARPGSFSVELRQVEGAYEARRNPPEAQQIVAEAVTFMRGHAADDEATMPSLGIVAINTEQRELIGQELRLRASRDERVERFQEKAKARGEELFIKNLENVQGDERDVILISLTYGPKPGQSTPHQRFGPINGKHGHRRLNVLFSRARDRIVLFTSLRADQIVADPGKSQGPQVLKDYLAYAEAGGQTVPDSVGAPADSDFEVEVRERLQRRGYTVDTQVGVSGYRIDLGVRNPDRAGVYLAGIECDGATYHSSKSARDRDRLRQDCLKEKGWEILRVWSTDWFDDPDGQTDKLARHLEELRQRAAERFRQNEMEREFRQSQYAPLPLPEEDVERPDAGPPGFAEGDGAAPDYAIDGAAGGSDDGQPPEAERDDNPEPGPDVPETPASSPDRARFVPARVADCGIDPNPARFYEASYRPALKRMVHHVIDTEGPIYRSDLVTRIARAHGFQRNGGRIEERILAAVGNEMPATTEDDGKVVYWPLGTVPTPVLPFRRAELHARGLASIPLAELVGLAQELLASSRDDTAVVEKMRERFDLGKLRETTRRRFAAAIAIARAHPVPRAPIG